MSKFKYLNLNPKNRRTGDCVIRATACAFDLDWEDASDLLYLTARDMSCEMSCLGCYSHLFEDLGLEEIDSEGFTVGQLSESNSDKILIIRIEGHLTCSIYGCIYDLWDCRDKMVDRAWIVA